MPSAGFEPRSQQVSGCRPTPQTARSPGSAIHKVVTLFGIKDIQINNITFACVIKIAAVNEDSNRA
jgi:hypothetical protein